MSDRHSVYTERTAVTGFFTSRNCGVFWAVLRVWGGKSVAVRDYPGGEVGWDVGCDLSVPGGY